MRAATIQSTTTVARRTGVNQIHPNLQPTKSAAARDAARNRQPSRWSKSFWRKKALRPQKAQRSTPSGPATPSKETEYAAPQPAQEKSPDSESGNSRAARQPGQ